jgi:hypothetical protein
MPNCSRVFNIRLEMKDFLLVLKGKQLKDHFDLAW